MATRLHFQYDPVDISLLRTSRFPDSFTSYYRPLSKDRNEIRLLTIQPGRAKDPLFCELQHVFLDAEIAPTYETISYCWGDESHRGWISINNTVVSVPISSMHALKRVRYPYQVRKVWIDAICINQDDVEEKSSQVAAMALIYRSGRRNLIYLGEDEDREAQGAIKGLKDFHNWLRHEMSQLSPVERQRLDRDGILPARWKDQYIPPPEVLRKLEPLYRRPWFRRLWVVQEAALAIDNHCFWGTEEFFWPWVRFVARFHLLSEKSGITDTYRDNDWAGLRGLMTTMRLHLTFREMSRHNGDKLKGPLSFNFMRYFSTATVEASDPRDRVYGLLAIFQSRNNLRTIPTLLSPDYRKSEHQVYRDATRFMLEEHTSGNILANDGRTLLEFIDSSYLKGITTAGMTSWTLRWDFHHNWVHESPDSLYHTLEVRNGDSSNWYTVLSKAVTLHTLKIGVQNDDDILTLRGFLVDEVWSNCLSYIIEPVNDSSTEQGAALNTLNYIEAVRSACRQGHACESQLAVEGYAATAEIMTAGEKDYWEYPTTTTTKVEALRALLAHFISERKFPARDEDLPSDVDDLTRSVGVFLRQMQNYYRGRLCFKTRRGYVGLGPDLLQKDDVVAIFEGESFPFILRPSGTEYLLVGAAYIYGLMDGEVFGMDLPSVWIDLR